MEEVKFTVVLYIDTSYPNPWMRKVAYNCIAYYNSATYLGFLIYIFRGTNIVGCKSWISQGTNVQTYWVFLSNLFDTNYVKKLVSYHWYSTYDLPGSWPLPKTWTAEKWLTNWIKDIWYANLYAIIQKKSRFFVARENGHAKV